MRKKKSADGNLRLLAWVLALVVAMMSLAFPQTQAGLFLELTAALIFAVGTVWPRAFRGLQAVLVRLLGRWVRRAWFF